MKNKNLRRFPCFAQCPSERKMMWNSGHCNKNPDKERTPEPKKKTDSVGTQETRDRKRRGSGQRNGKEERVGSGQTPQSQSQEVKWR